MRSSYKEKKAPRKNASKDCRQVRHVLLCTLLPPQGEKDFDTRYFDIQHAVEAGQYIERLNNMLPDNGPKGFANMYYNIYRKDVTKIVDAIEHEIIQFSKRQ